ncbi:hypothetical protein [Shinella sp. HZN7]|uniref:hypothetical protein n=1 Tax=Shinella sp. (strain HZN7) TaxID=879274 RepID=UPI0007DA6F45|nr:hypothetical protein [Shinella sp. HZN7]ANH04617.1 hypothetical protein shn_11595 [Shinella sp. HZN7]
MIAGFIRRAALPVITAGALLVIGLLLLWLILARFDGMVERAARAAAEARDAHWAAQIERANADANRRIADQAKAALAIETDANARVRLVEEQLTNMEIANAALPLGDACGLGRDRVRLLPN